LELTLNTDEVIHVEVEKKPNWMKLLAFL